MVGPDILVAAPPFFDKTDDYDAKLPSSGWYDFWTGARVDKAEGKATTGGLQPEAAKGPVLSVVHLHPELAKLPVFVRPGAILPLAPLMQSTAERPNGPLTLRVYPGPECAGQLYQDDGTSFAYKQGAFVRMKFTCDASATSLTLHIGKHEGSYPAWWKEIVVEVEGASKAPASVTVNGRAGKFASSGNAIVVTVPDKGDGVEVVVQE